VTSSLSLQGRGRGPLAGGEWEGEGLLVTRKQLLARAQWMRAQPTEAEKRLWSMLRDRRVAAYKFKRQQIISPYIVDFVCLAERLIIEADGSQHADNKDDARRDAFLHLQNFRVLRFWNNQVLGEPDVVADDIFASLTSPHPRTRLTPRGPLPLPQGERG
jgi:very-short-patch-repair endonuclease